MERAEVEAVAERLIRFLETGDPSPSLFHADVFCDFTPPLWRIQAHGVDDLVGLRRRSHPARGEVVRWRCDPTPTGFVLEFEERWEDGGQSWYCREMARADVIGGGIAAISVYCTGDWDEARQECHRREVTLLRP